MSAKEHHPPPRSSASRWFLTPSALCAMLVVCAAGLVMIGWIADVRILQRWVPAWTPMSLNAALLTELSALGLLALSAGRGRAVPWIGAVVLLASAFVGVHYYGGAEAGMEHLLMETMSESVAERPNRIALLSIVCFAGYGMALMLASSRTRRGDFGAGFLTSVVSSACLGALAGHALGLTVLYGFGTAARMALQTAILFLVLTLGLLAWLESSMAARSMSLRRWVPLMAALALMVMVAGVASSSMGQLLESIAARRQAANVLLIETRIGQQLPAIRAAVLQHMLLGDAESVEAYEDASRALDDGLDVLQLALARHAAQAELLIALREKLSEFHETLRLEMAVAKESGIFLARQRLGTTARGLEQELQGQLGELIKAGEYDRSELHLRVRLDSRQMSAIVWSGTLLAGAMTLLFGLFTSREIRQRERAERRLKDLGADLERRVERRTAELAAIFDSVPALMYLKDARGRFVRVNRKLAELAGVSLDTIQGRTDQDLGISGMSDYLKTAPSMEARGEADRDVEMKLETSAGTRWVQSTKLPVRAHAGEHLGVVGFAVDVTERKRAEDALWELNRHLEERVAERTLELQDREVLLGEFVKHAPAAIAMFDVELRCLRTSERWLTDYQLVGVEILGKRFEEFFPILPPRWKEAFRRVLEGSVEHCDEESFTRADGAVEWIQWEARPWHRLHGEPGGLIFFSQIITERKQQEEIRRALHHSLAQKTQEMERFVYTVSHDLKSPLVTIKSFAALIERDLPESTTKRSRSDLLRISRAADRMNVMLEELLHLSRVGRVANPPETVSVSQLAEEAREIVAGRIMNRGVEIVIPPDLPEVTVDRTRLVEVFQNLIENSVKFMADQAQPRITVGCRIMDHERWLFVADNGLGIEPRHAERVFRLFDKLNPRSEGTGVGLAIVRRIIEVHGGRVWIESAGLGHGTTFWFTLPEKGASDGSLPDPNPPTE